jgi:hypothetical protein
MSYIKKPVEFLGMSFQLKDGSSQLVQPEGYIKRQIEEYLNYDASGFTGIQRIPFTSLLKDLLDFAKKKADEEKKYFIPTIEDIHVGYECELLPVNEEAWYKVRLQYRHGYEDKYDPNSLYNLNPFWYGYVPVEMYGRDFPVICRVKDLDHLRVPYLTEEQIKKEGWTYKHANGLVIALTFTKGKYSLNWFWNDKKILIHKITDSWAGHPGNVDVEKVYDGSCPSINEFRKIMKLLNIK